MRRIINNPGVCRGGHFVLVSGVDWIRPRAYVHQHKLWERPSGFTLKGPNEVSMILDNIDKMIIGEGHMATGKKRNIFKKKPGLCWDN